MHNFIARILTPGSENRPNRFLRQIEEFVPRIALFGVINSISQTLIKLTSPGVPDIYQGQELFDFSLVDPDNRRPVDFELRQRRLREMLERSREEQGISRLCAEMLQDWSDGRLKLWVTRCALHARREYRELFELGDYVPLKVAGSDERHVVAYARTHRPADGRGGDSALCLQHDGRRRAHAHGRGVGSNGNRAAARTAGPAAEEPAYRRNFASRAANPVMS